MQESIYTITNLRCDACVKLTTKALNKIQGVDMVSVDLGSGKVALQAVRPISKEEVTAALNGLGYRVS